MDSLGSIGAEELTFVRDTAQDQMWHVISVLRPSVPSYDNTTLLNTASTASTIYNGIARIWTAKGGQMLNVGEELMYFNTTTISIPFAAAVPRVNDMVKVIAVRSGYPGDADTVGKYFRILDVGTGGLQAVRSMTCTALQESNYAPNV